MALKVMSERELKGLEGSRRVPRVAGYEGTGPTAVRIGRGYVLVYSFGIELYRRHKKEDLAKPDVMGTKEFETAYPELCEALFPR